MSVLQSFQLNGKLALITGSSAGIGFALARALGEAGAHVIINGRNANKVASAVSTLQAEGLMVSQSVFDQLLSVLSLDRMCSHARTCDEVRYSSSVH